MKTKTIIQRLKEFKKKYRLKQVTLSTMMQVNKFTLNRWLKYDLVPGKIYTKHIEKFLEKNNY
jgi:ribosome-binding protein aMBF1 (putative translation factor)